MAFIDAHRDRWPVAGICRVLDFSERSYHAAQRVGLHRQEGPGGVVRIRRAEGTRRKAIDNCHSSLLIGSRCVTRNAPYGVLAA